MNWILDSLVRIEKLDLNEYIKRKDKLAASRKEYKFLIPREDLSVVLDFLVDDFYLCVNGDGNKMIHTYKNHYFDTDDYKFFKMHRQGKYNRLKVRIREYKSQSKDRFLECKRKVKGIRTIKDREMISDMEVFSLDQEHVREPLAKYDIHPNELEEKITMLYHRLFFVAKDHSMRLTIDFNIKSSNKHGKQVDLVPDYCILEVKSASYPKRIVKFMKDKLKVRETGFSKYCVSVCMLEDTVKKNKWKQVLKLNN